MPNKLCQVIVVLPASTPFEAVVRLATRRPRYLASLSPCWTCWSHQVRTIFTQPNAIAYPIQCRCRQTRYTKQDTHSGWFIQHEIQTSQTCHCCSHILYSMLRGPFTDFWFFDFEFLGGREGGIWGREGGIWGREGGIWGREGGTKKIA
jgi:hypothetical protein